MLHLAFRLEVLLPCVAKSELTIRWPEMTDIQDKCITPKYRHTHTVKFIFIYTFTHMCTH